MLKRFATDWADLFVAEITPEMIRGKLGGLALKLGNHNANRHLIAVKATFMQAWKDGYISSNPVLAIPKFPTKKAVKYIPPREDILQVLLLANPLDRAYLRLAWDTAARIGEINTLVWEDVDFERDSLRLWTRKKKVATTPRGGWG